MNFAKFIAQKSLKGENKISKPFISVAVGSIALGIAVMIITIAIIHGFQTEIRNKVIGFSSHIQIVKASLNTSQEPDRILINPSEIASLQALDQVEHIQIYAIKPGMLETNEALEGVIAKGISSDFDWHFFEENLIAGRILNFKNSEPIGEILISDYLKNLLKVNLGEKITLYFVEANDNIRTRRLEIVGIYDSNLEEFDREFVFIDIANIQKINNWGIQAQILIHDTCSDGGTIFEALGFGGNSEYIFDWSINGLEGPGPFKICPTEDSDITVKITDYSSTIPDTAFIHFDVMDEMQTCDCSNYTLTTGSSGGSQKYYAAGLEINTTDFNDLENTMAVVDDHISYELTTKSVKQNYPDIFSWLELIQVNAVILIILMIAVAVINMTSALLILIMEKTPTIGILKALGSTNWDVRKIYLYKSAYLIFKGLLIGNIIGLGLAYIQKEFQIITLTEESYSISYVPILVNFKHVLLLNFGTILICLLVLILPSSLITKIKPAKVIRMN